MKYDVYGIGNALVDFVAPVNEETLVRLDLKKGITHFIDERQFIDIMRFLKGKKITILPGGSAANTTVGVGRLGGKAIFTGKVGKDFHAGQYVNGLKKAKVKPNLVDKNGITGNCISLVTKDNERTMTTCLGVSSSLEAGDINWTDLVESKIVHLEGYMVNSESQLQLIYQVLEFCRKKGILVSFDLSDPFMVKRFPSEMKKIASKSDIIFMNEEEAKYFTGQPLKR